MDPISTPEDGPYHQELPLLATSVHFYSLLAAVVQQHGFETGAEDVDILLAVTSDEKLLRLDEFDVSETVSMSGQGDRLEVEVRRLF